MFLKFTKNFVLIVIAACSFSLSQACSVEASKPAAGNESISTGSTIQIAPNSPADTVRVFYKNLREKRFREAIYLTNLRPAIEGLTDAELKEFQVDFETVATQIPQEIQINGEIITGDQATVTAKLPDEEQDGLALQEIRLRRENGTWVILTVDEKAEQLIKQEGKNYFYALRLETHHEEAKAMLNRISKAQMVYSAQNKGIYGEIPQLIEGGLLPDDVLSSKSTGYNYTVKLTADKKQYVANAIPAEYTKTGTLSFRVDVDAKGTARLTSKDNGGQPINK